MNASADPVSTAMSQHTMESPLVSSPVSYRLLHPDGPTEGLALLLFLHGGGGSDEFLETIRPVIEDLWSGGSLPPMVVATPSAGRSFYLDRLDGKERWEQFLLRDFIPHLTATTGAGRDVVALSGISMGGMGSLRLAFRHPERFAAVAVVEPAIEEATEWSDVLLRDRVYREDPVIAELYGDPVDAGHFRHNHPRAIAHTNGHLIAASGMSVFIECGDEDLLHLQYGAEALHRQLFAHGIDHEYRLVRGANHVGPSIPGRIGDALQFIGRELSRRNNGGGVPDEQTTMFSDFVHSMEEPRGYRSSTVIDGPGGKLEVHSQGQGPTVVLLPSLGRGAADFEQLSRRLARSGYRVLRPEPRGIGRSESTLDNVTLADLADDVASAIRWANTDAAVGSTEVTAVTVVGHAFGNRVARMVATRHPELVESIVLLASGGMVPPSHEVGTALQAVFDPALSPEEHLRMVELAFFAPGNDPSVWAAGWFGPTSVMQLAASRATPVETWWEAGNAEVLVVQPADDVLAVPANAEQIVRALNGRASMITIPAAGHALLPEQPAAVATALLTWLHDRTRR